MSQADLSVTQPVPDSQQPNTDLSQMDEIDLAQRFVDLHHSGDKAAARPYLLELIRRNELQQRGGAE